MMGTMGRARVCVLGLAVTVALGCGARTGLGLPDGAVDAAPPDVPPDALPDAPPDVPMLPDVPPPTCDVLSAQAELSTLDVFMLFDGSGSMYEVISSGVTKWAAVRRAADRFFNDPESRGIGIGLTFFPIVQDDVPLFCEADGVCGGGDGSCVRAQVCPDAGVTCNTDTDCAIAGFPNDTCTPIGFCPAISPDTFCAEVIAPCPAGACVPVGTCQNRNTCEPEAYATPVVPVSQLPGAAGVLLDAYDAAERRREDAGGTPTLPAVTGMLEGAAAWAEENPTHRVVAVLATDGFPSACDPDLRVSLDLGVGNVADVAAEGLARGIQTFVIGVFGPVERDFAQTNLNRIAEAGGTGRAFIANTASGLADEFLDALNQVRLDATACDFALTEPLMRTDEAVWVRIAGGGADEVWVPEVGGEVACAAGAFGFYFPPAPEPVANRIILCPPACAVLGASPNRTIELFTSCDGDPTDP